MINSLLFRLDARESHATDFLRTLENPYSSNIVKPVYYILDKRGLIVVQLYNNTVIFILRILHFIHHFIQVIF